MRMNLAFIGLGSNLGDRESHLAFARQELAQTEGCRLVAATVPEETTPFGPPGQSPYLNQMVALETDLEPHELLGAQHLSIMQNHYTEQRIYRVMAGPNAPGA